MKTGRAPVCGGPSGRGRGQRAPLGPRGPGRRSGCCLPRAPWFATRPGRCSAGVPPVHAPGVCVAAASLGPGFRGRLSRVSGRGCPGVLHFPLGTPPRPGRVPSPSVPGVPGLLRSKPGFCHPSPLLSTSQGSRGDRSPHIWCRRQRPARRPQSLVAPVDVVPVGVRVCRCPYGGAGPPPPQPLAPGPAREAPEWTSVPYGDYLFISRRGGTHKNEIRI